MATVLPMGGASIVIGTSLGWGSPLVMHLSYVSAATIKRILDREVAKACIPTKELDLLAVRERLCPTSCTQPILFQDRRGTGLYREFRQLVPIRA